MADMNDNGYKPSRLATLLGHAAGYALVVALWGVGDALAVGAFECVYEGVKRCVASQKQRQKQSTNGYSSTIGKR